MVEVNRVIVQRVDDAEIEDGGLFGAGDNANSDVAGEGVDDGNGEGTGGIGAADSENGVVVEIVDLDIGPVDGKDVGAGPTRDIVEPVGVVEGAAGGPVGAGARGEGGQKKSGHECGNIAAAIHCRSRFPGYREGGISTLRRARSRKRWRGGR